MYVSLASVVHYIYEQYVLVVAGGDSGTEKARGGKQKTAAGTDTNDVDDGEVYVTAEVVRERKRQSGKKRVSAFHLFGVKIHNILFCGHSIIVAGGLKTNKQPPPPQKKKIYIYIKDNFF